MLKGRLLFCIFLIAVAAYAIYSAHEWTFKTALFPLSVSIPLLILAAIQLSQLILGKEETNESAAVDLEFSSNAPPELERRRVITAFSWIIAFIASVYLVGFPLTVPLFILFYLKFESEVGMLHALVAAAITWGSFYGLFQWLVHIQFEQGLVEIWLGL